jgi:hypothetical protein
MKIQDYEVSVLVENIQPLPFMLAVDPSYCTQEQTQASNEEHR